MRYLESELPQWVPLNKALERYLYVDLVCPMLSVLPATGKTDLVVGLAPSIGMEENHIWEGPKDWVYEKIATWAGKHMTPC